MRSERRYRYRLYPTKGQQRQLARTFGCARVVYNDAIALRRNQWEQGGVKVGYGELDRAVITDAKKTPERVWLSEVSTVALQQAVRDAHRAYVNWWQHGAKPPRMRRKHGRQAFRLTQRGFRVRGAGDGSDRARVHLAKIGWVKVAWSRPLPSEPTSVTIVREPDGRYYASFVCAVEQRDAGPAGSPGAGIDVGLHHLAVIVNADGSVEKVNNPRHLRAAERKLARAQRSL
ncbi:MAG: transposase, partial [Egibacteraceae bacterium]